MQNTPPQSSKPGSQQQPVQQTPMPSQHPAQPSVQQNPAPSQHPAQPSVQRTSLSPSPSPTKKPARKRSGKRKFWAIVGSTLAAIAAIATILQFAGVPSVWSWLFPTPTPTPVFAPTPTPAPLVNSPYGPAIPGCTLPLSDKSNHIDTWTMSNMVEQCDLFSGYTILTPKDDSYNTVSQLFFRAAPGYDLASNQEISLQLANIVPGMCAGIGVEENSQSRGAYAFYICANGDWYIVEYSDKAGQATVLNQSTDAGQNPEQPSNAYDLLVEVTNRTLQMSIGGGETHTTPNPGDYSSAQDASVNFISESALLTTSHPRIYEQLSVSSFYYQQI